jgi:hypothetical protein
MIRRLLLLAAVATLGACADPAARIAAPDTAASRDGSAPLDCPDPRQNGSGQLTCP